MPTGLPAMDYGNEELQTHSNINVVPERQSFKKNEPIRYVIDLGDIAIILAFVMMVIKELRKVEDNE